METLLSQDDAARRLGLSIRSLERHRVNGSGPKFVKLGRLVKYRPSDLEIWVTSAVRLSTSDAGAP